MIRYAMLGLLKHQVFGHNDIELVAGPELQGRLVCRVVYELPSYCFCRGKRSIGGRPKGSVNRLLQKVRLAADELLPMEASVEFDLQEEGATPPARAVLQQAAAGELPLSSAKDILNELLPAVQQEEKVVERQAQPAGFMGAF